MQHERVKSLFIHIPKTAGTSLRFGFQVDMRGRHLHNYPIQDWIGCLCIGHISLAQLISTNMIDRGRVNESYVFAFMRDPVDRMVSLYYHYRWHKKGTFLEFCQMIYDLWFEKKLAPVGLYNQKGYSQANPQVKWLEGIIYDYVGKFERLHQCHKKLCRRLNIIPIPKLPHHHPSKGRRKTRELYDEFPAAKILVRKIYADDFKYLENK